MESYMQKEPLTEEQIKFFRMIAHGAEPYPSDAPELNYLDIQVDSKRLAATRARQFLLDHGVAIDE